MRHARPALRQSRRLWLARQARSQLFAFVCPSRSRRSLSPLPLPPSLSHSLTGRSRVQRRTPPPLHCLVQVRRASHAVSRSPHILKNSSPRWTTNRSIDLGVDQENNDPALGKLDKVQLFSSAELLPRTKCHLGSLTSRRCYQPHKASASHQLSAQLDAPR